MSITIPAFSKLIVIYFWYSIELLSKPLLKPFAINYLVVVIQISIGYNSSLKIEDNRNIHLLA